MMLVVYECGTACWLLQMHYVMHDSGTGQCQLMGHAMAARDVQEWCSR